MKTLSSFEEELEDEMMKRLFKEAMICSPVICLFVSRSLFFSAQRRISSGGRNRSCCLLSLRRPLHAAVS